MSALLPIDLQLVICDFAIGPRGNNHFAFAAMRVCKVWADFVCNKLYRHYEIDNYLRFIAFVKTIENPLSQLPYGQYIRTIDMTAVNRYGINSRAQRLIRCCPNLISVTLGDPTSVKPDTLIMMAKHCRNIQNLSIGSFENFPFIMEGDFSRLSRLREIDLQATPVDGASLKTFSSPQLRHVRLACMDTISDTELADFLMAHKDTIRSLTIEHCSRIKQIAKSIAVVLELKHLALSGETIDDASLAGLFAIPWRLKTLSLTHTRITDASILALTAGRLTSRQLILENNSLLSDGSLESIRPFTDIGDLMERPATTCI